VPDCSFEGCSHCGVCGTDFGHNIVIEPPPIPPFAAKFVPNQERVQRLRVWFGKRGDMAMVGHLDLARLFDRAVRRAGLPIAFTGGFHPGPRMAIANALPLGATSSGEIVDFELLQKMEVADFTAKLVAQLPGDIPIYCVEEVDLKTPAAAQLLENAEYLLTVAAFSSASPEQWSAWIEAVLQSQEINEEHSTKSGKRTLVNLRDRLLELELVSIDPENQLQVVLRYLGSCKNDGNLLRPEQVIYMLEQVARQDFQKIHVHRTKLIEKPKGKPE